MQKIQNIEKLSVSPLRKAALEIAEAGLQAIDTQKVVEEHIEKLHMSLNANGRLFVVGIGKCASQGVLAVERKFGDKIEDGIVFDVQPNEFQKARFLQGDHPFSTTRNREATKQIVHMLSAATESDTVLFLISGGGSALLCLPEIHTCETEAELIKELFSKGATIQELNVIRKHLSKARGGYLAQYAHPAKLISFIFSDVPGDDIRVISSGPTVFDETTKEDAQEVLKKYDVEKYSDFLIETPKDKELFKGAQNILVVSNKVALEEMKKKAQELDFKVEIKTSQLAGEARAVAKQVVEDLRKLPGQSVLLYGGETTVVVKNPGKGGRNLELALSALESVDYNELVLSLASDGIDNTEYAGAIADILTKEHASREKIDAKEYLEGNKSFSFFEKTGDHILTGGTGSNVSDLIIAIKSNI